MNNPSKQVEQIFNSMTGKGLNLNWCEKTNCWIVLSYDWNIGNSFFATILVDRKRK